VGLLQLQLHCLMMQPQVSHWLWLMWVRRRQLHCLMLPLQLSQGVWLMRVWQQQPLRLHPSLLV
jgi:hypothetical protein